MGKNSKIEWCDHTFNPWIGCSKVSLGCRHCYAERLDARTLWEKETHWGPSANRMRTSESYWRQPFAWQKEAKETGTAPMVFCASLADVFDEHPQVGSWRIELFEDVICNTPHLRWLILTKRPKRALEFFENRPELLTGNVWMGVSAENQRTADERIPVLLEIPAAVRFVSAEPLLGPVDFSEWLNPMGATAWDDPARYNLLDWVIVGGESGKDAMPMHPDWAREIRDQCVAAGVPFFFKQWGEWLPNCQYNWGSDYQDIPAKEACHWVLGHVSYRIGKKLAGRKLDGKEWSQFPKEPEHGDEE